MGSRPCPRFTEDADFSRPWRDFIEFLKGTQHSVLG
jgi:hypothetical protein